MRTTGEVELVNTVFMLRLRYAAMKSQSGRFTSHFVRLLCLFAYTIDMIFFTFLMQIVFHISLIYSG